MRHFRDSDRGGDYSRVEEDILGSWENCRSEARSIETQLDDVMHSYVELNTRFGAQMKNRNAIQEYDLIKSYDPESATIKGETELVTKIEKLLNDLKIIIDEMSTCHPKTMTGRNLFKRHKDIFNQQRQDYQRNVSSLRQKKDSLALFGHLGNGGIDRNNGNVQDQLLRERSAIQNSSQAIDRLIEEASATNTNLREQGRILSGTHGRLTGIAKSLPGIGGLITSISRRRTRDTATNTTNSSNGTAIIDDKIGTIAVTVCEQGSTECSPMGDGAYAGSKYKYLCLCFCCFSDLLYSFALL
eukprot:g9.t1